MFCTKHSMKLLEPVTFLAEQLVAVVERKQWRRKEFLFGGNSPSGLGDGGMKVRSGVQEQSRGRGSGGQVPEAEAVCRHCLQILTSEMIKICENFAQFTH